MDLVTGASGFLGNVIVRELLRRGRDVRVLLRETSSKEALKGLDVEVLRGDILDRASLLKACRGIDTVYHTAGFVTIQPGQHDTLHQVNVLGTRHVIEACKRSPVRRLMFTSSITALQEPQNGACIDEDAPFSADAAKAPYERTKAIASLEVLEASRNGLDAVILCPTGIIGPYDFLGSPMTQFFSTFLKGRYFMKVQGAYDFVDVRDAAIGHILASEKGKKGHVYILSGHKITVDALFSFLEKETGIQSPRIRVPVGIAKFASGFVPVVTRFTKTKPCFTKYTICTLQNPCGISYEKAARELGYQPRPIEDSLRDTVRWVRENR